MPRSDGNSYLKKVTYATFVRYVAGRNPCPADVDYVWKTDSRGTKYRYVRKVIANKYSE